MQSANGQGQVKVRSSGSFQALLEAYCRQAAPGGGWHVKPSQELPPLWMKVYHEHTIIPEQGWKLHVSASVASAEEVLRRAVPVLLEEAATFKTAASFEMLDILNQGFGGETQVGKFITVYPVDDAQAVRLAVALDEATRGLRGPSIPSDRVLRAGSLVYYRYGSFGDRYVQTPLGEMSPAIATPDGELVPDRRATVYRAPEWVSDPFEAAGVTGAVPDLNPLVGDRYLIVATIYNSPRSAIYIAADLEGSRHCVLKRARRNTSIGLSGWDACDYLRNEAAVLARLAPDPRFPEPYDLLEHDGDLFLAMEDIEGVTLEHYVCELAIQCRFVPCEQIVVWARELAGMLDTIHRKGLIYRDLKSPNILVTPQKHLRLLDFDIACDPTVEQQFFSGGTRGYMSPEQHTGTQPPAATADVYGLGALMYFMATRVEPSQAPRPFALLERPVTLLNPAVSPALADLIARCLDPDPARRFPSMQALDAALAAIQAHASVAPAAFGTEPQSLSEAETMHHYRMLAKRLGDTICAAAQPAPNGPGLAWSSSHPLGAGVRSLDINTGNAGTLLALAEIVGAYGEPAHRRVLEAAAHWLSSAPRTGKQPLPGLYVGEAGIGAALLRAGQVLGDTALIAAAAECGRLIAGLPFASPDLFNGTAGRLRFHLWLWDATGEHEHLNHAISAGRRLVAMAEDAGDGAVQWTIPPGYDGLSDKAYLGYAHGAAGIAGALLELYEVTGDEDIFAVARGAARWLARQAVPVLEDGSGLNWPAVEGQVPASPFWCHGAAGIGNFFLHAAQHDLVPEASELAQRAARAVARGARWVGPTQCHGLAGNIEFLLNIAQITGDRAYLTEAYALARLLEAFASEQNGMLRFPSESPQKFTPDYMVGYAGVAVCLLRLGDPLRMPQQLSRRGFQYQPELVLARVK